MSVELVGMGIHAEDVVGIQEVVATVGRRIVIIMGGWTIVVADSCAVITVAFGVTAIDDVAAMVPYDTSSLSIDTLKVSSPEDQLGWQ